MLIPPYVELAPRSPVVAGTKKDIESFIPAVPSRLRRWNRGVLWTSAFLVAVFAFFPSYVGRVIGASAMSAEEDPSQLLVLGIEGMTCTGCEASVEVAVTIRKPLPCSASKPAASCPRADSPNASRGFAEPRGAGPFSDPPSCIPA